jgi:hypothetical protein
MSLLSLTLNQILLLLAAENRLDAVVKLLLETRKVDVNSKAFNS